MSFEDDISFSTFAWLRDLVYPVGSIRMTTDNTGATTFLGGTWELWGEGRVPVGVDSNDRDLAEWERQVKLMSRSPRPPERESVRNRLRQLQEQGRQQKPRKKSFDRDSR